MSLDGRFDPPIRPATDADGPAIGALMAAVFTEYPGCLYEPAEYPELAAVAAWYLARNGRFWVAEDGDGLAGCIGLDRPGAGEAELHRLYVARRARRRGLAARLLALVLAEARSAGDRAVVLWTDTRFTDAHRFYARHGFVRGSGTRALDDVSRSVEYLYRLRLVHASR